MTRRARIRRVESKRPIPYTVVLEPAAEGRSDIAVAYLLSLLDERRRTGEG